MIFLERLWGRKTAPGAVSASAGAASQAVQTAPGELHPFGPWLGYQPLQQPDWSLYAAMREAVPVIDAALDKIIRLTGQFRVACSDQKHQRALDDFTQSVRVGPGGQGLQQFVGAYLDSLLTFGNAVGELIPDLDTGALMLYNARLQDVRVRRGDTPLDITFCASRDGLEFAPVPRPELILFTPLSPPAGELLGQPLLRCLPFVTGVLMKIFGSTGVNFERVANLRYAVTWRPGPQGLDHAQADQIAAGMAREWSAAMSSTKHGDVRDFVAVGDVSIKVIGADGQQLDTEVPVRQMLEQIVAKLGIPPFMLGLHWSSTERMSTQQADILTSELWSYRQLLTPVIQRVCDLWLALQGWGCRSRAVWDDINLQDEVEAARARLTLAQAMLLEERLGAGAE